MQVGITHKCNGDSHHRAPCAAPSPSSTKHAGKGKRSTHPPPRWLGGAAPPPAWAHVPPSHPCPATAGDNYRPRKYQQKRWCESRGPRHLPPLPAIGAALLLRGSPVGQSATCFTFLSSESPLPFLRSPFFFLWDHHCQLLHSRRVGRRYICAPLGAISSEAAAVTLACEPFLVPDLPSVFCLCCCLPPEPPGGSGPLFFAAPLGSRAPIGVRLKVPTSDATDRLILYPFVTS